MRKDGYDGESHACDVAVCVAYKDAGGVSVVNIQGQRDGDEWKEDVQRQEVRFGRWMRVMAIAVDDRIAGEWNKVERRVEDQKTSDDERLADFNSVDTGEDINAVWSEDGEGRHICVVEGTEIDEPSTLWHVFDEHVRNHNRGNAEIDVVDD